MRVLPANRAIATALMLSVPAALMVQTTPSAAQTMGAKTPAPDTFHASVNEVSVTFNATDLHGLPINDLTESEIRLFDNEKRQNKILSFSMNDSHAIRTGILIDTSKSMEESLPLSRTIARQFASQILRGKNDLGFVMSFGFTARIIQPWTADSSRLITGIAQTSPGRDNALGGTSLFDTVFQTCFSDFARVDAAGAKFILLFSDGGDNASHTSLADVVNMCQRSQTAIYAFRPESKLASSLGTATLTDLASQTGGRIFHEDDSQAAIDQDLRIIESELRNQYRIVYRPSDLHHDGAFHHIELLGSDRVAKIGVRSGYYDRPH